MAAATLGQLEPFDPQVDDWVMYTERTEQFFVANGIIDDAKKVSVLLTSYIVRFISYSYVFVHCICFCVAYSSSLLSFLLVNLLLL